MCPASLGRMVCPARFGSFRALLGVVLGGIQSECMQPQHTIRIFDQSLGEWGTCMFQAFCGSRQIGGVKSGSATIRSGRALSGVWLVGVQSSGLQSGKYYTDFRFTHWSRGNKVRQAAVSLCVLCILLSILSVRPDSLGDKGLRALWILWSAH